MMPKRKDFSTEAKLYWKWWWDNYESIREEARIPRLHNLTWYRMHSVIFNPKLKKNKFYPKEYNYNARCPKHHNKLFHIRPRRRDTKLLEHKLLQCGSIMEMEDVEEKYYVNHRKHVYWS